HDGHNGSLRAADRFASQLVPKLLKALGPRGVLYLTWDEGRRKDRRGIGGPGGGRIPLIVAGGAARPHTRTVQRANHYALLRTLEAGFGLPALGKADEAPVLRGLTH
ncbi:MAG: phosphatidylinositol-3-phosphatase, partial [Frankiales bacterium]|nr:phosphatidylinositol-3-phosphatase [Frankiales bacterium]